MAVKLVFALRQRPHLNLADFQKIWQTQFGPLVASLQTPLRLYKYIQLHRYVGEIDDGMRQSRPLLMNKEEPPFDIIDEYYFDLSVAKLAEYRSSYDDAWKILVSFQSDIINPDKSYMFFVQEQPHIMPSPQDTLIASPYNHILRAHVFAEMSDDMFGFEYWSDDHAPLVRKLCVGLGIEKYIQNHPRQNGNYQLVLDGLHHKHGILYPSPYTWYASIWMNENGLSRSDQVTQAAMKAILEDEESGFMKPGTMNFMIGKEHVFVDKYRN